METFPHRVPPFEALDAMGQQELDELPFGILDLDHEGRIRRVNRSEAMRTGRDPEEFIGRNFFDNVAPCTAVRGFAGAFREGARRGDLRKTFQFRFPTPSGGWDAVIVYIASVTPGSGWVMATVGTPPVA